MFIELRDADEYRCPLKFDNCQGSKCMAWRWRTIDDDIARTPDCEGFCGLAGRPISEDRS